MAGVDRVRGGRHQRRASRERAQQTPGDDFGVLDPKGALLVGGAQRGDDDYERVAARRVRCSGPVRARRGRRARGCVACRAAEPPSNPRASSSRWFDAPADPAANFVLTALRETGDVVAELGQRGALRSLTDSRGRTAYDIRIDREKNGKSPKDIAAQQQKSLVLQSLLKPPPSLLTPDHIRALDSHLADVIDSRIRGVLYDRRDPRQVLRYPPVGILHEVPGQHLWFPVAGIYGGFDITQRHDYLDLKSWCRVFGCSDQAHLITHAGAILVDEGFV